MQVDLETVSSDTYVTNIQVLLLGFCEQFMDSYYTKPINSEPLLPNGPSMVPQIDPAYLARSGRIELKDVTRVGATAQEVDEWIQYHRNESGT